MRAAFFIAVTSFFIGQPHAVPEAIRHPLLQALPVLGVVVALVYCLVRVRLGWRFTTPHSAPARAARG